MDKKITFTVSVSDPRLSGEEIFDHMQSLFLEDYHGRAEIFYGSPEDLVDGGEMVASALRARIDEGVANLTDEQAKRLLKAIFEGDLGKTGESDEEIPYAFRVAFTASRVLKASEIDALENALCAQIEDPHVPDEDGNMVHAEFSTSNTVAGLES